MIKAVLDTNVLASGLASQRPTSGPARIMDLWRGRSFTLAVSEHILDELARTFQDRYFRQRLAPEQVAADLALLRHQAVVVIPAVDVVGVAAHPQDDLTLATAVSARADYLVTGDTKLRRLASYRGITIVSPQQFLDVLEAQPDV